MLIENQTRTKELERNKQAHFVWVDMGVDPRVVGRIRGSDVDYGAPLHAQPTMTPWSDLTMVWTTCGASNGGPTMRQSLTRLSSTLAIGR